MLKIIISNEIKIFDPTARVRDMVCKVLTIDNPLYYKLLRATGNRARAFYGTPKEFKYYKEKEGVLVVPRGMRVRLLTWLEKIKEPYQLSEEFINIKL